MAEVVNVMPFGAGERTFHPLRHLPCGRDVGGRAGVGALHHVHELGHVVAGEWKLRGWLQTVVHAGEDCVLVQEVSSDIEGADAQE